MSLGYLRVPDVPVRVAASALTDRVYTQRGKVDGFIAALCLEEGKLPEFVFETGRGEQFYELPFSATGCSPALRPVPSSQAQVCELLMGRSGASVVVFDGEAVHHGFYQWSVLFPADNDLRHCIKLTSGAVGLWPPYQVRRGSDPTPLPTWWSKRRYTADDPIGETQVLLDQQPEVHLAYARQSLREEAWTSHGLGFLKHYRADFRVHLWSPELQSVGTESAIHSHRWDLTSSVVYGEIFHEEYLVVPRPGGPWRIWDHGNSEVDVPSTLRSGEFDIQLVFTHRIRAGFVYTFPRGSFHRTVVRAPAVTVVHRAGVAGKSSALVLAGHHPVRGDQLPEDEASREAVIRRARVLLEVEGAG